MKKFLTLSFFLSLFAVGLSTLCQAETVQVFAVSGDVKVVPRGRNIGIACEKAMVLQSGDWVKTGSNSSVSLAFDKDGENAVTIEENSLVIVKLDGYFKIQLLTGEIYAILENVEHGETFRVLTPSAVTEATSSGWGAKSDGTYTNVVVFDNKVFICGINKDGSVKKEKFWIEEGYQRKTINFEDPGALEPIPETMLSWFKEQVVAHHLTKELAKGGPKPQQAAKKTTSAQEKKQPQNTGTQNGEEQKKAEGGIKQPTNGNTIIADGEEINLVDFLYKQRLIRNPTVATESGKTDKTNK
jgi:hypothetical protein